MATTSSKSNDIAKYTTSTNHIRFFRPDRWLDLPSAAKNRIGLVSGLMTFSVGPHVSLGSV